MNHKNITILGSTGSIGCQSLEVIASSELKHTLRYLTTNRNIELLSEQIKKYSPYGVVIASYEAYIAFKNESNFQGKILYGEEGLSEAAADSENDLVISALVGFSGVIPTLAAINNSIDVALANKETLVSAGEIITNATKKSGAKIIAVDSEHNAILQCLIGENYDEIEKLILTASGGPFRDTPVEDFHDLTVKQALNHPNWSMGSKITIDSATMMNKGFEVIEAYWLFGIPSKAIEVTVHPQSIVHSMVQFVDGSIKAQLGLPDMRTPISYALNFPKRYYYDFPRLNINEIVQLTFFEPDLNKFKCLDLAFKCLEFGGNSTAVLNAANEVAVDAFLKEKIKFSDIPIIIQNVLDKMSDSNDASLEELVEIDKKSRDFAVSLT